ncbi:MAG: hypothetical protein HY735_28540 [Verrucomicrobia bacterium]|nr:hypothetical protein [Verrucomicrobiota bacterium]
MAVSGQNERLISHAQFVHTLLRARDWQDRPEFTRLCDWWRGHLAPAGASSPPGRGAGVGLATKKSVAESPSRSQDSQYSPQTPLNSPTGVCALVGIGRAGKTAIAEHFLRVLPGGLPARPDTPKDTSLSPPRALFVFSFYDAPNPGHFFAQLYAWLNNMPFDESARTPSYQQTLQLLSVVAQASAPASSGGVPPPGARRGRIHAQPAAGPASLLLILDGLEKVQDDGARGGAFGQLLDGRLHDLILRAADGRLPGVALLITSRIRLLDSLKERSVLYRHIDIDQVQAPAALALLRARGVRGTDAQLRTLIEESGFHALTLDLLGGYVAAFCGGDRSRLPRLDEIKIPDEVDADEPPLAAVNAQSQKLHRFGLPVFDRCELFVVPKPDGENTHDQAVRAK